MGQLDGKQVAPNSVSRSRQLQAELPCIFTPETQALGFSPLPTIAGIALTADVLYALYLGETARQVNLQYIECWVSTAGAAAVTAEVAVLSTPEPGGKGLSQTLTKLASQAITTNATGVRRNATAFNVVAPADTHLWAAIRCANVTGTKPTIYGVTCDWQNGLVLTKATAGALTAATASWAGGTLTPAITWQAPYMRLLWN